MEHPQYPSALNELFKDTSVSRAETLEAIEGSPTTETP